MLKLDIEKIVKNLNNDIKLAKIREENKISSKIETVNDEIEKNGSSLDEQSEESCDEIVKISSDKGLYEHNCT